MIFVINHTSLESLAKNHFFNWMTSLQPVRDELAKSNKCSSCKQVPKPIPDIAFLNVVKHPSWTSESVRLREQLGVAQLQIRVRGA